MAGDLPRAADDARQALEQGRPQLVGSQASPADRHGRPVDPRLVRGVRAATQELAAPDPLPTALKELNEALLTRYKPQAAAELLIDTTAGLDTPDRQAAIQAIFGIT